MLTELHVKNFLLIQEARLHFDKGLNVLSGETGHGKSIVIDAFSLLLGERASPQIIRTGESEAFVEAVFDLSARSKLFKTVVRMLSESGVEPDVDEGSETLLVKRLIRSDGRSQAYLNGSPVLVKTLKEVGDLLVDIHGQHEHQSLLHRGVYLDLLDAFAGAEPMAERIEKDWRTWNDLQRRLQNKQQTEALRKARIAELDLQLEEIDGAELDPEEEERLKTERKRLQHAEQLRSGAMRIHALLHEGPEDTQSATDLVSEAESTLEDLARVDKTLEPVRTDLESAGVLLKEIADRMLEYGEAVEFSQETQEQIDERLFVLHNLKSKYGPTIASILDYAEEIRRELHDLKKEDMISENLDGEIRTVSHRLVEECLRISDAREKAAKQLTQKVLKEFTDLGLAEARAEILLSMQEDQDGLLFPDGKKYQVTSRGRERVEILMAANPGQAMAPLREAASGGEISRIMLALKSVFAGADQVPTLVFDEIDIGIGGRAAQTVANKLHKLSESHQVLCITHLAAIASKADANFAVAKEIRGGKTFTTVKRLEGDARTQEITRMLTGSDSAASRKMAKELLEGNDRKA